MSLFEPKVAAMVFDEWIKENQIEVLRSKLDRSKSGIVKNGKSIISIRTLDGHMIRAKIFVDATYEGDLMALAGVSYTTGREAASQYGESANGIQPEHQGNQLPRGIDPYVIPKDSSSALPNHKTDSNNDSGASTDFIGMNYDYPVGDYAIREKIAKAHEKWQLGLIWTLQHHPRVPEEIRKRHLAWGLPKDEFVDNGNWAHALYVREARRMVGQYVATQKIVSNQEDVPCSIGMGAYKMDSHHVQRYVTTQGDVQNEGDVQASINGPYRIDYGTIVPKKEECDNLFVTFCVSASHIAFGSIRMEPVFMVLSQSAATAGAIAIDGKIPVQDVPYEVLKNRLLADGQRLSLGLAEASPKK